MESKNITMNLSGETLGQVSEVLTLTNTENKTRVITSGVSLMHSVVTEMHKGNKVYIEDANGARKEVFLTV